MRAFIAIELPESFVRETASLARQLKSLVAGRFSPRENYHITLAFLGKIDEACASRAIDAIDAACAAFPPIEIRVQGLGKFGRSHDATLWLDIAQKPQLEDLVAYLRDELDKRDIPFDGKPFKAHVTLARRARIPARSLPELMFPAQARSNGITLFKSTLKSEGATYKPLHHAEFQKPAINLSGPDWP